MRARSMGPQPNSWRLETGQSGVGDGISSPDWKVVSSLAGLDTCELDWTRMI